MTALADLAPGDQFLFVAQVTATDATAGTSLALFGPDRAQAATAQITPAGVMSGQLANAPSATPVTVVTGFVPLSPGDVVVNAGQQTMVVRRSWVDPSGRCMWASGGVSYSAEGWTVVAHVNL